jgi:hypothetical protein
MPHQLLIALVMAHMAGIEIVGPDDCCYNCGPLVTPTANSAQSGGLAQAGMSELESKPWCGSRESDASKPRLAGSLSGFGPATLKSPTC